MFDGEQDKTMDEEALKEAAYLVGLRRELMRDTDLEAEVRVAVETYTAITNAQTAKQRHDLALKKLSTIPRYLKEA